MSSPGEKDSQRKVVQPPGGDECRVETADENSGGSMSRTNIFELLEKKQ